MWISAEIGFDGNLDSNLASHLTNCTDKATFTHVTQALSCV